MGKKKVMYRLFVFLFGVVWPIGLVYAVPFAAQKLILTAESPLVVEAGREVAQKGGNVADVAVAMGLALAVTHPQSGSLGGGGFALLRIGKQVEALDFREVAPKAMHPHFYKAGPARASRDGALAIGVPGVPLGLFTLHQKYGKLKWEALFEPALRLVRNGVPVSREMHQILRQNKRRISQVGRAIFFERGRAKQPGDIFVQPQLERALVQLRKGISAFYEGDIAKDILESTKNLGGVLSLADLTEYKIKWRPPLHIDFNGHRIYLMPPPSSGGVIIATALQLIERSRLGDYPPRSSIESHLFAEILHRAFRGRALLGDPDFHSTPIQNQLLNPKYIEELASSIRISESTNLPALSVDMASDSKPLETPHPSVSPGGSASRGSNRSSPYRENPLNPPAVSVQDTFVQKKEVIEKAGTQTTHYAVMDAAGNAISITTTLNSNFGSGIFTNQFGIALNNEMDDFTTKLGEPNQFGLVQGVANQVEPGKRPLSSMSPTLIERKGKIVGALGARGGPRIISAVTQTLYRLLVNKMNIDQAIQTWRVHQQFLPADLFAETNRTSTDVLQKLRDKGHRITSQDSIAKVFGVYRPEGGFLEGAFDSRGEGAVGGL